jgi:soluble lytic murein transglycosylase-like protein
MIALAPAAAADIAVRKPAAPVNVAVLAGRVGTFHVHEIGYAPEPTPPAVVAVHLVPPTPKPTPTAPASWGTVPGVSYAPGTVAAIIMAAAAQYGVDGNWMVNIAHCESGLRPNAYNPGGPYVGIFQFLPSTFAAHGGTNIYDPTQQANIAANMIAHGGAGAWPVCSRR